MSTHPKNADLFFNGAVRVSPLDDNEHAVDSVVDDTESPIGTVGDRTHLFFSGTSGEALPSDKKGWQQYLKQHDKLLDVELRVDVESIIDMIPVEETNAELHFWGSDGIFPLQIHKVKTGGNQLLESLALTFKGQHRGLLPADAALNVQLRVGKANHSELEKTGEITYDMTPIGDGFFPLSSMWPKPPEEKVGMKLFLSTAMINEQPMCRGALRFNFDSPRVHMQPLRVNTDALRNMTEFAAAGVDTSSATTLSPFAPATPTSLVPENMAKIRGAISTYNESLMALYLPHPDTGVPPLDSAIPRGWRVHQPKFNSRIGELPTGAYSLPPPSWVARSAGEWAKVEPFYQNQLHNTLRTVDLDEAELIDIVNEQFDPKYHKDEKLRPRTYLAINALVEFLSASVTRFPYVGDTVNVRDKNGRTFQMSIEQFHDVFSRKAGDCEDDAYGINITKWMLSGDKMKGEGLRALSRLSRQFAPLMTLALVSNASLKGSDDKNAHQTRIKLNDETFHQEEKEFKDASAHEVLIMMPVSKFLGGVAQCNGSFDIKLRSPDLYDMPRWNGALPIRPCEGTGRLGSVMGDHLDVPPREVAATKKRMRRRAKMKDEINAEAPFVQFLAESTYEQDRTEVDIDNPRKMAIFYGAFQEGFTHFFIGNQMLYSQFAIMDLEGGARRDGTPRSLVHAEHMLLDKPFGIYLYPAMPPYVFAATQRIRAHLHPTPMTELTVPGPTRLLPAEDDVDDDNWLFQKGQASRTAMNPMTLEKCTQFALDDLLQRGFAKEHDHTSARVACSSEIRLVENAVRDGKLVVGKNSIEVASNMDDTIKKAGSIAALSRSEKRAYAHPAYWFKKRNFTPSVVVGLTNLLRKSKLFKGFERQLHAYTYTDDSEPNEMSVCVRFY